MNDVGHEMETTVNGLFAKNGDLVDVCLLHLVVSFFLFSLFFSH